MLCWLSALQPGYWARPDLNETSFYVRQVFPNFDKVFYRTGDLVRQREDGQLMFLGRKDRQIKIRGYRVELDEIEQAVCACDPVAEAAVVALRDSEDKVEIVAAAVLQNEADTTVEQIRHWVAARLPAYAVPSRFYLRSAFPRTTSGKINRKLLAEEYQSNPLS
jgi:acyl-coenzyme A synthetase/AMP-(fatty) acid ligase